MNKYTLSTLLLAILATNAAQADDYKVYSPIVEQGEFSLEANMNYSVDGRTPFNGYLSQVDGFEYGMTNWWKTELAAEIEEDTNTSMRVTHLKWENIIVPFRPGENWVDLGFYGEVEKALRAGDPDNVEGKLLLSKKWGQFTNTLDLIAGHNFGSHPQPGMDLGFSWQTLYNINDHLQPGFEYYSDIGKLNHIEEFSDQDNVAGPVLKGKWGEVGFDAGLLEGLPKSAHETTLKLNLEFEF
jgi:hypothetical protein